MNDIDDTKITVAVIFCDTTTIAQEFEPSAWGKISANEAWSHYVEMGKENETVFAKTPHVSMVRYLVGPDEQACEHFGCDCDHESSDTKALVG